MPPKNETNAMIYTLRRGLTPQPVRATMFHVMPIYEATPDNPNPRLGWVYVLSSPDHTYLKVGATRKHPIDRAKEISAGTGVPRGYSVAYYRDFEDAFAAESLIHAALADCRVNESREFFNTTVEEVVNVMDSLDTVGSAGLTGGEWVDERAYSARRVATPFAELFASFPDRGDGVLNEEEQAACRALEGRMSR